MSSFNIMNMTNGDFMGMLAHIEKELAPKPTVVKAWKKSDSYQVTMMADMSDGSEVELFNYYPDEIQFSPFEFIGKTEREAGQSFEQKYSDYLRS